MALSTPFCFERKLAEVVSINCEGAILFSLSGIDFHNPGTYAKYSSMYHKWTHFQKAQGAICIGKELGDKIEVSTLKGFVNTV